MRSSSSVIHFSTAPVGGAAASVARRARAAAVRMGLLRFGGKKGTSAHDCDDGGMNSLSPPLSPCECRAWGDGKCYFIAAAYIARASLVSAARDGARRYIMWPPRYTFTSTGAAPSIGSSWSMR